jgi:hypothetical protein
MPSASSAALTRRVQPSRRLAGLRGTPSGRRQPVVTGGAVWHGSERPALDERQHRTPRASSSSTRAPASSASTGTASPARSSPHGARPPAVTLRPRPHRPRRRALDPQRGVPPALGPATTCASTSSGSSACTTPRSATSSSTTNASKSSSTPTRSSSPTPPIPAPDLPTRSATRQPGRHHRPDAHHPVRRLDPGAYPTSKGRPRLPLGRRRAAVLAGWHRKRQRRFLSFRRSLASAQGGVEDLFAVAGVSGVEVDAGLDDLVDAVEHRGVEDDVGGAAGC